MISEIVDSYVEDAIRLLPRGMKTGARRRLKNMIYEMLEDYTEGEKPNRQDLRAVLEALGTPSEVGRQIFSFYVREKEERIRKTKRIALTAIRVLYALALALVVGGILSLVFGTAKNALPLGLAALCGVAALALQAIFPGLFDRSYPEKDSRKAM